MPVRQTSIDSHKQLRQSGSIHPQHEILIKHLMNVRRRKTADASLRELSTKTGIEMSTISARINELKENNIAVESTRRKCTVTKNRTIVPVKLNESYVVTRKRRKKAKVSHH